METYMKFIKKTLLLFFIVFVFTNITIINCFAASGDEQDQVVEVTDIILSGYDDVVEVGSTTTLSATVFPDDATEQTIAYSSSDNNIATVNPSGEIKGISAGKVEIIMKCGDFEKRIFLTVKVSANLIKVNQTYVVLSSGENFIIKADVLPDNATDRMLKYVSADNGIATVDQRGKITAQACGATAVTVSNGDTDTVVTVIVNSPTVTSQKQDDGETPVMVSDLSQVSDVSECPVVSSEMLKALYKEKKLLHISADGYVMEINGRLINNFNNEVSTNIDLKGDNEKISFNVNGHNHLCGPITLYIEGASEYKYLYLYNESTREQDLVQFENLNQIDITMPGEYTMTKETISKVSVSWRTLGISGVVLTVLGIIYICIKKQYWFW